MGNLGSATDILYFNKVMSSTMHWPYLGVIIVQKIPSESLQYNSTTVFMTCNEMAATVSCRHGSHTQVSTLPYPPTGQSPCISMAQTYMLQDLAMISSDIHVTSVNIPLSGEIKTLLRNKEIINMFTFA